MAKFGFLGILLISIALFGSCSNNGGLKSSNSVMPVHSSDQQGSSQKSYGAYIAGRVAHLRKDFNKASDYYIQALKIDPDNKELVSRLYLLLASKGRVDEAAYYAQESLKNGDDNNFIYVILAVQDMKQGRYAEVQKDLKSLDNPIYKEFINPLLIAWSYAGENKPDKALKSLQVLKKEPSFKALYNFHAGMINDYFGRNREAQNIMKSLWKKSSWKCLSGLCRLSATSIFAPNKKTRPWP